MARVLLSLIGCSALVGVASACAAADNVNCPTWIKAGFCDMYTPVTLAAMCPKSCPKAGCGAVAVPTTGTNTTTAAENTNCAKWNSDPLNVFCATATDVQKKNFCKTTCAKEITPVEDCAIYVNVGGKVTRTGFTKTSPEAGAATTATATNLIVNVFAKPTCKVDLYTAATVVVGTGMIKSYPGTTPYNKITVAAEGAAAGLTCTCT